MPIFWIERGTHDIGLLRRLMRDDLPPDPFGRSRLPAQTVEQLRRDLLHRQAVAQLHRVALRLQRSRDPDSLAVAAGLFAWLQHGGDLAKRLGVRGKRGRHRLKIT